MKNGCDGRILQATPCHQLKYTKRMTKNIPNFAFGTRMLKKWTIFFYFIKFCISIYIFSFSLLWISFGFIFFSVLKLRSPFWIWKERSYLMGKINFFDQLKSFAFIEYFHFVYCQNFKENFSAFKLYGKQCFPTSLIKAQHFSYSTSASSLELWKKFLVADSLIKLLTFYVTSPVYLVWLKILCFFMELSNSTCMVVVTHT